MPKIFGKKEEEKEGHSEDRRLNGLLKVCSDVFNLPVILAKMTKAAREIFFLKTKGAATLTKQEWDKRFNDAKRIIEDGKKCLESANYISVDAIDQIAKRLLQGNIPKQFRKLFLPSEEEKKEKIEEPLEEIFEKHGQKEMKEEKSPLLEELMKEEE